MGKYVNPHAGAKRIEQKKKKYINPHSGAERNRGGVVEGTAYLAGNLGLGVAGVAEGLTDIAAAGSHLMRGDLYMAKQPFIDSKTAEAQQDLEEWYNPGKGMQFAGDVVSGAGQSVSYGLLSAIPIVGTPMMFASIGSQGVSSAAGRTGDVGLKELGYGATVGAVEGILESKLGAGVNAVKSLGSAALKRTGVNVAKSAARVGGKSMIASVLVDTAKGAAGEFAEEAISETVDPALLRLFNVDENAQFNLGNVLYAGVVGALSGGLMTAGPAAINFESARKTGQSIREAGEVEQTLHTAEMLIKGAERAQTTAKESKATEKPGKDASVGQKITSAAKSAVSGIKNGQEASKARQMADKLQKNVAAYRQIMADPAKATSGVADALLGELRGNMYLAQVAYQIETYEAILANAEPEQKQQIVNVINAEAAKLGAKRSDYTVADLEANTDDIVTKLAAEMSLNSLVRVFDTAEATEKPAEAPTSPWDGMADNEDVSGYKAAGEAEEALLKAAVKESVPRGSVQAMLDEFRKGTDMTPEEFAAAWSDGIHIYGRYGFDVGEESPLSRMSPEAREAAMKFGRETEEAERKSAEEKAKAKKKPAEMAGKKGTVVRGKGLEIKTLSDEQYAAYKAAEVLAEVLGTDIVIETKILTPKGKEANGYYKHGDNTIHININALRNGKNVALYTLGHEITHYIKEWSPRKFEALADFVLEQMGIDAETAVADKLASLKRLGIVTDTMTIAEANALAREELVAEGMELVLTDGKVMEELSKADKSLWEKIRDWFFDIIGQIRRSWQDLNQASKTAQVLKETVESLEEIERLFTEGVREAGERTRKAGGDAITSMAGENMHDNQKYSVEYENADTNSDIIAMVDKVKSGNFKDNEKVPLGTVPNEIADVLYELTGVQVAGFKVAMEARQVEHILKDHGESGSTDRSMADPRDIAKMEYALKNPDDIRRAGKTQAYSYMRNGRNRTADTVLYEKNIGEKSYYVVQAVPDTKAKTLYVVTAFIGKEGYKKEAPQLINAESLDATSENGSANTSTSSITQPEDSVNTYTENSFDTEDGVMIDPASGTAMLSVDDIPKTEQEIDDAVNRLVQKLGVDESRARKWVEDEISLATLILRDDMVDYAHRKADRRLTAIVKNSDYKQGTLDFSNICRKRREYTRMMQRIQQAFPNRRFTAEEFATIRKIMVDEGLEVACGLCYVEDRRQNEGYIAETFQGAVEAWRKGNRDTYYDTKNNVESAYNKGQAKAMAMLEGGDYVPTIADLTTVEGMNKLQAEHKDILQAWKAFNNARGMSSARLLTNEAEYQRQILKYNKARVKAINDLGGLRVFSFSDFEEFHLIDIIQAVQDCAAMGIKIQFYTKVPSFALLMKDTKAKGNLSLIPKGDLGYEMKNGKRVLVYDPVEGIDFNDPAFKEVARGNPNIGTILVGINDEHILTAMEDDFIDYIIPFHTGQTEVVRQIKKIGKWQNYKNEQVDKPWESGSKAKTVNVYTDVIAAAEREGDPIRNERQFVERFLKVCEERGLRPRFSRFLNTNAEGKYVYTKGYYKLLLDFKMFDKDGTYLPQEPVIPEFDADLLHELTEKYVAGEKAKTEAESPAFKRALERVEAEVVGDDEGRMYSIDEDPDTAYLAAVERGDMETAQKMVDEAAKAEGYKIKAYHGTNAEFTVFDKNRVGKGIDQYGAGFYFASNADVTERYGNRKYDVYLSLKKPIRLVSKARGEGKSLYDVKITQAQAYKILKKHPMMYDPEESPLGDFYDDYWEVGPKEWMIKDLAKQYTNIGDLDADVILYRNYPNELHEAIREVIGYDGVEVYFESDAMVDERNDYFYVAWFDNQMKSADPVTYDDNGNVIPLSERFKEDDSDIRYSIDETPETRDLTDREILGMALEGAVQSQEEYNIVKSYREQAALLELVREKRDGYIKETNALERQIKALRTRMEDEGDPDGWIRKAMDDAIAKKREAERMRDEQVKILDNADRELLRMKAAKPFREILAREQKRVRAAEYKAERAEEKAEKARETTKRVREEYQEKIYKARRDATDYKRAVYRTAYEKAEEKNRAYRERTDRKADESRERKEMTARKRTIMRVLGGLQTKLVHPTKTNHAPKELHDLVQTVMRTADPKAWDTNRKNIREMGDLAAAIEKLERQATRTAKEQERLDRMKSKYEILEQQTMPLAKQAQAMYAAYKQYNDTLPEDMRIPESVMTEMSEMVAKIEDVPLKEMGLESLKAVETFVKALSTQINNANELFVRKRGEQVSDWGNAASREAAESKPLKWLSPKSMEIKNARDVREFLWKNMKPLTAFEAIGSPKLMELFQSVLDGEEVWITDVLEAREAIVKAKEKYGYDTWDLKTRREFTNGEGKTVRLTVGEMMSLYAYAKREQAMGHLHGGGFVLDAGATEITEKNKIRTEKMLNLTERYTMTEEDMGKLAGMLTEEQKQYATEIQDYLTSLGEKGNEISRKLYGLDLFNEKYYFPIKVKSEYLESQTGKTGDPKIKNRGTSKETVPDAQNPLVLQDFMTIVSGHVNDMATYHAFVLPVEDLTRVLNYQPSNAIIDEAGNWTEDKERKEYSTLKAVIESKYGAQANAYIEQLIRDLNGGARREAAANLIDKGITAFKRASTMASLSVLVQQPTSVFRAMAYIDPKHFRSLAALDIKGHKEAWEQVKKYAKVAAIKEMGGYDTGVGTRTADYLNSKDYKTWGERAKAFFLPDVYGGDSNYRAEIFGKGAAYADELAWIQMFDACKREQAEKLGKPVDSEEVLEAAGKRFTEVVRRTQVYDSTLTRSEYMRSKDTGMKMATAFMAEPTTVVSMMLDGLIRANRGDKAFLKKTVGAIAASVIFNALAVSLIYAARDDDEEKTYTEKYLATLATETAEGFNPLEYLPYTRDVMSLMKGYDIERTDMALFADLFKSFERITSSTRTPVEKTTEVAGAIASFFGVPIRNLVRDAMIPVNLVQSATSGERTTGKGISAAIADEFSIITNLFGADTTNAHELYKAAKSGDDAHYNRVKYRYKSEQAAEMALRTALRENDKRIAEAAEAKISGELEAYESIVEQIESEGRFDRNLIIRAINNEVLDIKDSADQVVIPEEEVTDEEDETAEPLYGTSDLNDAMARGDREDFEDIYYYLLATKQEQGKTEAQAKAAVKSGITSYWKKQYLAAWAENNTAEMKRILELLEGTELYGEYDDVATMAQKWIQES